MPGCLELPQLYRVTQVASDVRHRLDYQQKYGTFSSWANEGDNKGP